jgi:hypothetical protein
MTFGFYDSDKLCFNVSGVAGAGVLSAFTTATFRDPSAWYHIVLTVDTTQSSASTGMIIWVNGVRQTLESVVYTQNADSYWNLASHTVKIGANWYGGSLRSNNYFDGYISDVYLIDGQALTPSSFAAADLVTGQWKPAKYTGTYGTNGFHLEFGTSTASATGIGKDTSTSGTNNWTPNNISDVLGATYDSMYDSPSVNYATLNPLTTRGGTFSEGNLYYTGPGAWRACFSTIMIPSTGKWYAEAVMVGTNTTTATWSGLYHLFGIAIPSMITVGWDYQASTFCCYADVGKIHNFANVDAYSGTVPAVGDVIGVAVDRDANTITFYKNNTQIYTATIGTTAGADLYFCFVSYDTSHGRMKVNFGQRPFSYTPPTGHNKLHTGNLTAPTIAVGNKYMQAYTYTGNGAGQQIGEVQKPTNSYQISRSLRFRSSNSAHLTRTPTATGNRRTWTWSGWVKRGSTGSYNAIFHNVGTTGSNYEGVRFTDTSAIQWYTVGGTGAVVTTSATFKDNTMWYHIAIVCDTTLASATDRQQIWINGVRQTTTGTQVAQNFDTHYNNTVQHSIGCQLVSGSANSLFIDGYLAEVNFVDGQALTPTSFGTTDANGYWIPQAYTGTYGTNGFYLNFSDYSGSTSTTIGKDGSGNTNNWTPSGINTATGAKFTTTGAQTWTAPAGVTSVPYLIVAGGGGGAGHGGSSGGGGGGAGGMLTGTATVVPGTTYTITVGAGGAATVSGSNSTLAGAGFTTLTAIGGGSGNGGSGGSGGGGLYNSGTIGSGTAGQGNNGGGGSTSWSSGHTGAGGGGGAGGVGASCGGSTNGAAGGAGLASSITGDSVIYAAGGGGASESDSQGAGGSSGIGGTPGATGVKRNGQANTGSGGGGGAVSPGAAGSGGSGIVILQYAGGSPLSTNFDSMIDSPTLYSDSSTTYNRGSYATMSYIDKSTNVTISDCGLKAASNGTAGFARGTIYVSTGKWYWEVTPQDNGETVIGIANESATLTNTCPGVDSNSYGYYGGTGNKYNGSATGMTYGATFSTGDVIGVALDMDAGTLTYYKNGVSQGVAFTGIVGRYTAAEGNNYIHTVTFNFGQTTFRYTPPTGYKAVNTYNITEVITDLEKPDLVWIKSRSAIGSHYIFDSIRGVGKYQTIALAAEDTDTNSLRQFNKNGFLLGSSSLVNTSGTTYAAWAWKAGSGVTSTNTAGTITSTVSVNTTAGFSLVEYTGTSTTGTVGHGLGVTPAFVMIKDKMNAATAWIIWHQSMTTNGNYLVPYAAQAVGVLPTMWTTTSFNSTTLTLGTQTNANGTAGNKYAAYCWAEVAGYSKFGSYTGDGNADGPFVYCGFRPKFIWIKSSSNATGNWMMYDSVRNQYNVAYSRLATNATDSENMNDSLIGVSTTTGIDMLSNGFKIRGQTGPNHNTNGDTFIFAAWAETPFKYASAR